MHRVLIVALVAVLFAAEAPAVLGDELATLPAHPAVTQQNVKEFPYGPGHYFSWFKIVPFWLLFALWVRTLDWMSRDGHEHRLPYREWNMAAFFSFLATVVLFWLLPWFFVSFTLMVLAWFIPFISYIVVRNGKVMDNEKVFTAAHLRFWLSTNLKPLGIKIEAESKKHEGPPVTFEPRGGADQRTNTANLLLARQSEAFNVAKELFVDVFSRRAEAVLMDFTQAGVAMRYQIDGVWHEVEAREREEGDAVLAVLKLIAALDYNQRVARQQGAFGAEYEKVKYDCKITSQGTKTGERVVLQIKPNKKTLTRLHLMDVRPKVLEDFKAMADQAHGLIVISAPPAGGLSTLFAATIGSMDRYMRSFAAIEAVERKEMDVENVQIVTFKASAGETPATVLPKLIREHPDAYVVPDMVDVDSAMILLDQIEQENRMVVTSVRAKEVADSLLRLLALDIPPDRLAAAVTAAFNQRLIRKLCPTCKEAYVPPPQLLEQMGIPAGRVEALYRPPQQPEEVCEDCQGIGYKGRTGLYEVLIIDDGVREALANKPQLAAIRQAARKAGMRTLQEEGILLVAKGVTSVPELMRVLKE